jgi:large subunit ribosomal protein L23
MLLKPIFSEKSIALTALNKFSFRVVPEATKTQIKAAIQDLYKVNVISITTAKVKTRQVRSFKSGKNVTDQGYKRAIVQLKSGQKINLFNTK